jgi:hypothetical protein
VNYERAGAIPTGSVQGRKSGNHRTRRKAGLCLNDLMEKRYVHHIEHRTDPQVGSMMTDVYFTQYKEKATYHHTEQDAESECFILDNAQISITTAEGHAHRCKDFKFEERKPGEFIIFCDAPFTPFVESPLNPEYKSDLQTLSPVAIKANQHEVRASGHGDWGSVTCDQCKEKFYIGPNRIYGTRGNKTQVDYAREFEKVLALDHEQNIPHQNAYDLDEI